MRLSTQGQPPSIPLANGTHTPKHELSKNEYTYADSKWNHPDRTMTEWLPVKVHWTSTPCSYNMDVHGSSHSLVQLVLKHWSSNYDNIDQKKAFISAGQFRMVTDGRSMHAKNKEGWSILNLVLPAIFKLLSWRDRKLDKKLGRASFPLPLQH